jgi:putative transposase
MKAYKYKLRTNKKFVENAQKTLDLCRELYNASIQERRDADKMNGISLNYHAQAVQLPAIKKDRHDLSAIHSQVLQDVLRRSDKAFDNFFRRSKNGEKPGYPRFKSKDRYDSFTYPQSGFRLEGDKLHLSKIGSVRVRLSRPVEGTVKTCTIKRECDGWYVIFTVEPNQSKYILKTGKTVGIDVGLETFAKFSDDGAIENPRFFRESEGELAKAQRKLATKRKSPGKRRAAKKIVAKVHRKIANRRKDFAHKGVNKLLKMYDGIGLEKLNVKGLQQSNLAKSISDVAWTTFTSILQYKAAEAGRTVVFVDPRYTSQDCSRCGHRKKLTLADRIYHCDKCGLEIDRDLNAARNIWVRAEPRLRAGISLYSRATA